MSNVFARKLIQLCKNQISNSPIKQFARLASSYKAAVITEPGKPLNLEERKPPKLKSKQVRIQIAYCSVNSVDVRKFKEGHAQLPFVPGYELAGEVIEKGKDIPSEKIIVGDRVVGLSLEHFGGFAEQCVLDVDDVWRIPSEVDRKDAAVLAFGHSTALYAFSKLTTIKEKEKVVVTTGPAGMGLAAVDVAANIYSATVIGVVDTEERGELVRNRGAFTTVAFSPTLQKNILKETDKKGANIVYDAVGDYMLDTIGSCAAVGGKVFHAAPIFYKTIPVPTPHSFLSIVSLKALRKQNLELYKTIVEDTLQLANDGAISAHISARYELKDVNEAIKFIEDKKCTGKVLIHVD